MAIKHFRDYFFGGHICERWMPGGDDVGFRSHLAWARRRNTNLKHLTTKRCLKSTVLVALMIRTNNMIVFSNSDIAIAMRLAMAENAYHRVVFWLGISLGVSVRKDIFLGTSHSFTLVGCYTYNECIFGTIPQTAIYKCFRFDCQFHRLLCVQFSFQRKRSDNITKLGGQICKSITK